MTQDFNLVSLPEGWYGVDRKTSNLGTVHPDRIRVVGGAVIYLCENFIDMACLAECRRNPGASRCWKTFKIR